jgi:hypothetical protein
MAVEPARSLDNEIHRGKIGNHEIEIQIKRLFDDLRCDKDHSSSHLRGSQTTLTKYPEDFVFDREPIAHREPRMEKFHVIQTKLFRETLVSVDRIVHCVPYPAGTTTLGDYFPQNLGHFLRDIDTFNFDRPLCAFAGIDR